MKKLIKYLLFTILFLIIGFGFTLFVFPEKIISFFIPSIAQVSDIQANVKKDTAYINTKLVAQNSTFFSIKMDTLKYKISFANKIYFRDKKPLGLMLKRYNKDTFNFSFKIPYSIILDDMKHEKEKRDSTNFLTDLTLQYSTFFGKAELPIAESGKIKIPEPPEIQIVDLRFKKELDTKNILAEVKLKVTNHSLYSLKINKMSYTINVLQFANVKGVYAKPLNFKGNSVTEFNIPIEVELKKEDKSLMSILRSNEPHHYVLVVDGIINSTDFKQERATNIKLIKEDDVILMQ